MKSTASPLIGSGAPFEIRDCPEIAVLAVMTTSYLLRLQETEKQNLAREAGDLGLPLSRYFAGILGARNLGIVVDSKTAQAHQTAVDFWRNRLIAALEVAYPNPSANEKSSAGLVLVFECGDRIHRRAPAKFSVPVRLIKLPADGDSLGPWLELAVYGMVIRDRDGRTSNLLRTVREQIAQGWYSRKAHGMLGEWSTAISQDLSGRKPTA